MTLVPALQILAGIGLLLWGRKLFWLFVAGIGFIAATEWATTSLSGASDTTVLLIGLAAGVIGALLAIFVRRVGVGLIGFIGGALLAAIIAPVLGIQSSGSSWVVYIVGGIIGLVLIYAIFDWALVILSALTGAIILSRYIPIESIPQWVLVAILAVIGISVQSGRKRFRRRRRR